MIYLSKFKRVAFVVLCGVMLLCGANLAKLVAGETVEQSAEDRDAEIEGWVQRLSSEDPADRAEAYARLKEYGSDALPHLNLANKYLSGAAADLARQLRGEINETLDKKSGDHETKRQWQEKIKERESNLRKWIDRQSESFDGDMNSEVEEILKSLEDFRDEWAGEPGNGGTAEHLKKAREAYEEMLRGMRARHKDLQKQIEEMWKRAEEARIQALKGMDDGNDIQMIEMNGSNITCTMITNGDRMTYHRNEEGAVEVTVQKKDSEEQVYRADSFDEFKKQYPEVVKKYELTENGLGGMGCVINIEISQGGAADSSAESAEEDITDSKHWEKK